MENYTTNLCNVKGVSAGKKQMGIRKSLLLFILVFHYIYCSIRFSHSKLISLEYYKSTKESDKEFT